MSSFLITGTSRGIGLELVRQLATEQSTQHIFAVTRADAPKLNDLIAAHPKVIHNIIIADLTSPGEVGNAVGQVEKILDGRPLDYLVNNAGIMPIGDKLEKMTPEHLMEVFQVNVVSAQVVTNGVLGLMRKGKGSGRKIVAQISSELGSIANAKKYTWMPAFAYQVTKAAMNALNMQYALELGGEGFTFVAISPGWLKTDMGSEKADLDVPVGVNAVKEMILTAGPRLNGKFMNIKVAGWENAEGPNQYDGGELPY